MTRSIDRELAARLRAESEASRDQPYPAGTTVTRPNRDEVYSVYLSPEEQAQVESVATARRLPAATLVRSWILDALEHEAKSA